MRDIRAIFVAGRPGALDGNTRIDAVAGVALADSRPITSGPLAGLHEVVVCLPCRPGAPCAVHAPTARAGDVQ